MTKSGKTPKKIKESQDLLSFTEARAALIFPSGQPLSDRNATRMFTEKLGFKFELKKIGEEGQAVRHVTKDQADELLKEFKRTHWRKFKSQEAK